MYKPDPTLYVQGGTLIVAVLLWISIGALGSRQHLSGEGCDSCHLASNVNSAEARKLRASEEKLCSGCHRSSLEMSHPSGFMPNRPLPDDFPLDWKGDLTCSTCHQVHGEIMTMGRTSENGKTLCLRCHDSLFFQQMRDGGTSIIHSGHLDARNNVPTGTLDNYSVLCLGCHEDELSSQGLLVTVSATGIARHGSGSANHPVGVDYVRATRYGGYRSLPVLNPTISLPEGKVSCVSCHEGYSGIHGKTLSTKRGLCLECHDL